MYNTVNGHGPEIRKEAFMILAGYMSMPPGQL